MATNTKQIANLDIPFKEFMPGQVIQSVQFNDDMNDIEDKVNEIIGGHNLLSTEYSAHTDDKNNPHDVDAHQVGTYDTVEIDGFVEDIKNGGLYNNALENRVLADNCVDTRNYVDNSITVAKLESTLGSQIDISTNMSITDRYTKTETDALIQAKVGDGTYDKATIDKKFEEVQAGNIVDKTLGIEKFKDNVGEFIDLSKNPHITNRYTKNEVNAMISKYGITKDWGSVLELPSEDPTFPPSTSDNTVYNKSIADYAKAGNCVTFSDATSLDNFENFEEGDVITSERLNYMLDSIRGNNVLISNVDEKKVDNDTFNTSIKDVKTDISNIVDVNKNQDEKISNIEKANAERDNEIIERNKEVDKEISDIKSKDTEQDNRLTNIEAKNVSQQNEIELLKNKNTSQDEVFNQYSERLKQIEIKNSNQDARLNKVEHKNKVQDVFINGLFNENADGRLSIEGEGNNLKLEGSKNGLVEIESIKGNTLVNLVPSDNKYIVSYPTTNPDNIIGASLGRGAQAEIPSSLTDFLYLAIKLDMNLIKPNTTYTLLCETKGISYLCICSGNRAQLASDNKTLPSLEASFNKVVITTNDLSTIDGTKDIMFYARVDNSCTGTVYFKNGCILEGDYTNKPIPQEYFEGLQSSFEDKLITQDMIDEGLEEAENLGKYKVPVRVVGKNLFDINNLEPIDKQDSSYEVVNGNTLRIISTITTISTSTYLYHRFKVNLHGEKRLVLSAKGIPQTVDMNSSVKFGIRFYNSNKETVGIAQSTSSSYLVVDVPNGASYCGIFFYVCVGQSGIAKGSYIDYTNIQLEEVEAGVSSPSTYEPYFERTTNVYLNSPLLEGDEIVPKEDGLYHYHKRSKVVLDGSNDEVIQFATTWTSYADIVVFTSSITSNVSYADKNKNYLIADNVLTDTYNQLVVYKNGVNKISVQESSTSGNRLLWSLPKDEYTLDSFKQKLQSSPTTIVYELAEPYYEPIQADKLILECANDSTLHIESIIPVESIKATYTGNIPSVYGLERSVTDIEEFNVDMVATTFDMDYRLLEVEWALEDAGISGLSLASTFNLSRKEVRTMALSRYEQAKIMILGGAYDKDVLTRQLTRYLEKKLISQDEYDELISLMEARELVENN